MRISNWNSLLLLAGLGLVAGPAAVVTFAASDSNAAPATSATTDQADAGKSTASASASASSGADGHAKDKDAPKGEPGTYGQKESYPHSTSDVSTTAQIAGGSTQSSGAPIAPSASVIENRIKEWKLGASDVQAEIDAGKPIVRTKSAGVGEPTGQIDDDALETLISNRLLADSDTVRVTTKVKASHGEVTLGGVAATPELIGRAIAVVLDTKGVTKVTANMKIDPMQPGAPRDDAARIQQNAAK